MTANEARMEGKSTKVSLRAQLLSISPKRSWSVLHDVLRTKRTWRHRSPDVRSRTHAPLLAQLEAKQNGAQAATEAALMASRALG